MNSHIHSPSAPPEQHNDASCVVCGRPITRARNGKWKLTFTAPVRGYAPNPRGLAPGKILALQGGSKAKQYRKQKKG